MTQRFAIYYAPDTTSGLWDRASAWLGRDSASGEFFEGAVAGIERTRLLNLTQSASRYGFHATIKPPMALADGETAEGLRTALADFAARQSAFSIGRLRLASLHGFLALVPETENETLQDFAADVVETFDPFRAPLSDRDKAARRAAGLSPHQEELLEAYGYPYVFDQFRFHMTLTDRLAEDDHHDLSAAANTWFGPLLGDAVTIDRLVVYHEPDSGRPFRRLDDFRLGA
ncbi:DUF1045 domain-containing protein [Devosia sp. 63-57]|uniref:DUF1045 domain-containing protein n=1 Tax=Devosia sp. 63-57 TaxID=1895751 RepID=UPI00086CEB59|nr:DUF1045 domain-containing protein [Devosia sp. 63-57]ODT48131.1 MAG: hypothetical protein ABS74_18310 [Pelagibacterium sp. SCN 63-126]ODU85417.1 MAG: hypothetical protein ABT14_13250 [Pelagibacterium sp. SCN 63-17]OJX42160.1 MAG: hypothetical protein BGO80_11540 [Devosia sp. 63-57]